MKKKIWLWSLSVIVIIIGGSTFGYYFFSYHQAKLLMTAADKFYQNKNYAQALDIYQQMTPGQCHRLLPLEQAHLYINAGNCFYETGKYSDAIPFFAKAAEFVEKHRLLQQIEAPAQLYNR